MSNNQKILQELANHFDEYPNSPIGDTDIAQAFKCDIHEARVYMQELLKQGYIVLEDLTDLTGERWIVMRLTSKGWVSAKSIK